MMPRPILSPILAVILYLAFSSLLVYIYYRITYNIMATTPKISFPPLGSWITANVVYESWILIRGILVFFLWLSCIVIVGSMGYAVYISIK